MSNFSPKRPVKSFMDLEVYQKLLEYAVFVAKYVCRPTAERPAADVALPCGSKEQGSAGPNRQGNLPPEAETMPEAGRLIFHQMLPCALGLPHLIAEAHSVRFGSQKECLVLLERAMLNCNKMVVYLEETRDICVTGVDSAKLNELIKKYLYTRQKILNLQRSWKKYMDMK